MQPLLQPVSPTGITILLWCVCSAAAALVQPGKNNEPQPLPDSPPTPFTVVVRSRNAGRFQLRRPCRRPPSVRLRTSHFSSNLTSRLRSLPSAPIQSAAARAAATFTLVEFCHGGAGDEQDTTRAALDEQQGE